MEDVLLFFGAGRVPEKEQRRGIRHTIEDIFGQLIGFLVAAWIILRSVDSVFSKAAPPHSKTPKRDVAAITSTPTGPPQQRETAVRGGPVANSPRRLNFRENVLGKSSLESKEQSGECGRGRSSSGSEMTGLSAFSVRVVDVRLCKEVFASLPKSVGAARASGKGASAKRVGYGRVNSNEAGDSKRGSSDASGGGGVSKESRQQQQQQQQKVEFTLEVSARALADTAVSLGKALRPPLPPPLLSPTSAVAVHGEASSGVGGGGVVVGVVVRTPAECEDAFLQLLATTTQSHTNSHTTSQSALNADGPTAAVVDEHTGSLCRRACATVSELSAKTLAMDKTAMDKTANKGGEQAAAAAAAAALCGEHVEAALQGLLLLSAAQGAPFPHPALASLLALPPPPPSPELSAVAVVAVASADQGTAPHRDGGCGGGGGGGCDGLSELSGDTDEEQVGSSEYDSDSDSADSCGGGGSCKAPPVAAAAAAAAAKGVARRASVRG